MHTEPDQTPATPADMQVIRNRLFDEMAVGDSVSVERKLTASDLSLFAALSGDVNPRQLNAELAASPNLHDTLTHGMLGGTLFSALLGTRLPGPGSTCLNQSFQFHEPIKLGDTLKMRVEVSARDPEKKAVTLVCTCTNQSGAQVISGEVEVVAPKEHIQRPRDALPEVGSHPDENGLQRLMAHVRSLGALRAAVVHPCNELNLSAAIEARESGLIEPVLVAPRAKLEALAAKMSISLNGLTIEDVPHSHAAAKRATELASAGKVDMLIKGSLHTDELMSAVIAADSGLRTERRISHCFLMQTPAYPRPFIITDAAINIAPTLEVKADIVRNAIELAHAIGVTRPRVAILAAVETVNSRMPSTLDAAALCKMADRGQIEGAILDGPLAFDNAISAAAAQIKGIHSEVAGQADILVVPDLESGNMLAKQLEYLGGAASAGIVMGARVPIVLTSRADPQESRIASIAVASLLAHRRTTAKSS